MWTGLWYDAILSKGSSGDDSNEPVRSSFPLMSLIDRLPPPFESKQGSQFPTHSFDLLRRGGRDLNLSGAVASGEMVVLGEAYNTPLPCPLKVDGQKMTGDGTSLYQAVLPLDRSEVAQPPTTQGGT